MGDHTRAGETQFVSWFGPLFDALSKPGGSGSPEEVTEQIAADKHISNDVLNGLTSSG
ncbi:hypothetical protein [Castellaniella sp.]|uniref:hypothetical protein n=1 Tax=Castellaniella sp. TaxID=1955812 RepID=UPI0025BD2994|nr:hypothetical protein [Castellaniella sp.]